MSEPKRLGIAAWAADRIVPVDRLAIGLDRREQNRLLLRYWVGLTPKEPAQVLEEPEGTIRRRTAEALARLREREEQ